MDIPKLYLESKSHKSPSTVVSMRMPSDMLAVLDGIARDTGRSRSELMTVFLDFAMQHMEVRDSGGGKPEK